MKTFGFYSPKTGEFVIITADSSFEAHTKLREYNELFRITTEDYIYAGSVRHDKVNDICTFNTSLFRECILKK